MPRGSPPLSFPDGCRHKCGSGLGQRNGNPRLRTYVRLRTGIFSIEAWYATTTNFCRTSKKITKFHFLFIFFIFLQSSKRLYRSHSFRIAARPN